MTTGLNLRQIHAPFYGETMTWDRFLHILHFLCFADNSQRPNQGKEYDRLWKIRTIFDTLNQAYAKFYNPSEHLAVDEVNIKFKGWVIFRQYIPKKGNISVSKFTNCLTTQRIHMT
jgi:hypothetical protein